MAWILGTLVGSKVFARGDGAGPPLTIRSTGLAQPSPLLQVLRAQHASLRAPQTWQVNAAPASPPPAPWQAKPALQLVAPLPPQQDWPLTPHALHVPAKHVAPDAVQVVAPPLPVQHAWASAPQVWPAAF